MRTLLACALALVLLAPTSALARTEPIEVPFGDVVFEVDAPDGMGRFAELAADVVRGAWGPVASAAGADGSARITVSIEREIADWFERRGEPPRNPEWAAGLAIYSASAVIVRTANPEWESTLRHELAHMAVDLATGGRPVPRWFNEGFAIATAEQWSIERAATMIRAGLSGNFYSFAELTPGFPAAASSADLAYAQSFHFVRYVREEYGEGVFVAVMRRVREGASWDEAFEAETGTSQAAVEEAWARHVTTRYKWTPALTGGGGAWGLMAALTIVAWRRHKRIDAQRLAALGASEAEVYGSDPDDETFG